METEERKRRCKRPWDDPRLVFGSGSGCGGGAEPNPERAVLPNPERRIVSIKMSALKRHPRRVDFVRKWFPCKFCMIFAFWNPIFGFFLSSGRPVAEKRFTPEKPFSSKTVIF